MSDFLHELQWRGLIHQITDPALATLLKSEVVTGYIGFDPSADSLGAGNLLQILSLVRFQRAGHRPIALAGGVTGMIGDPSFKADERALLEVDQVKANVDGVRTQLARFLDFDKGAGAARALLVDNSDWLAAITLPEFLRNVGKHFTVNAMMAKESVRARLNEREQGISYTEFSYMLLQAYDFLQLFDSENCRLEMGGSDQWGNITAGVDLVRRVRGSQVFGLTTPLVMKSDGTKLGKSESGNVWLDPRRTSPYRFYQYFVRVDDTDVIRLLKFFTFLEHERIDELDDATKRLPQERSAQRVLAFEVTSFVHGEAEARKAEQAAQLLFSEELGQLAEKTLVDVFADAPSTQLSRAAVDAQGLSLVEALVTTGVTPSKSAARQSISQGGIYLNNRRVTDDGAFIKRADLLHGRYAILRKGKRDHHLVEFI